MVRLHFPTPIPTPISITIPMKSRNATLGLIVMVIPMIPMIILMQSNNGNQLQYHLISTNIGVKLGTLPICIGIGITIGIDVGSVETDLHSIMELNFIGIGVRIGVGQCKHTITPATSISATQTVSGCILIKRVCMRTSGLTGSSIPTIQMAVRLDIKRSSFSQSGSWFITSSFSCLSDFSVKIKQQWVIDQSSER